MSLAHDHRPSGWDSRHVSRLLAPALGARLASGLSGPMLALGIALLCALGLSLIRSGPSKLDAPLPPTEAARPATPTETATPASPYVPDAVGQLLKARDAALGKGDAGPINAAITGLRDALARPSTPADGIESARLRAELGLSEKYAGVLGQDSTLIGRAVEDDLAALAQFRQLDDQRNAAIVSANLLDALLKSTGSAPGPMSAAQLTGIGETALSGIDPVADRLTWARTQVKIGTLLLSAGAKAADPGLVDKAINAYRAGLVGADRDARSFTEWAEDENLLGNALEYAGDSAGSAALRRQALQALNNAWLLYQLAGKDQYGFFFNARISALEARINGAAQPTAEPAPAPQAINDSSPRVPEDLKS